MRYPIAFLLVLCACATAPSPTIAPRSPSPVREDCPRGAAPLANQNGMACWPIDATDAPWNCRIIVDDFGYKFWDCSMRPLTKTIPENRECEDQDHAPPGRLFMHLGQNDPAYHLYLEEERQEFHLCPLREMCRALCEAKGTCCIDWNRCVTLGTLSRYRSDAAGMHVLFENDAGVHTVCSPKTTCPISLGQDPESYGKCITLLEGCIPLEKSQWPDISSWSRLLFNPF